MNKLGRCNLIQSDLEVSRRRGEREGGIKQRYPTLFVKYLEKCKVTTPVASVAMQSVEWFEFRELQFNFETFPSMESIFGMRNRFLLCQLQNFFDQLMIYSFDCKFFIIFSLFFFLSLFFIVTSQYRIANNGRNVWKILRNIRLIYY